jgi:uncharacterized protein (DUF4415 family)
MAEQENQSAADEENPEWTPEDMRRARPAREILPELFGEQPAQEMLRWGKPDTRKRAVTIPLDEDLLRHFQETGPGWENKINQALREWLETAKGR